MTARDIRRITLPSLGAGSPQRLSPLAAYSRCAYENSHHSSDSTIENPSSESNSSDEFSSFLYPFGSDRPSSAATDRERTAKRIAFRSARENDAIQKMRSFSISKQGKMTDCGICYRSSQVLAAPQSRASGRRATCPEIWLSPDESDYCVRKCILRIFGSSKVGKKTIAQRLFSHAQTSYTDIHFLSTDVEDGSPRVISFMINGNEFELEIIQGSALESEPFRGHLTIYVLVYSIDRRDSFEMATQTLYRLFENLDDKEGICAVVVANKIDLQRCRHVSSIEGKTLAKIYRSAYVEMSAIMPLNLDLLWKELLRKIQKHELTDDQGNERSSERRGSIFDAIKSGGRRVVRSCEELVAKIAAL